LAWIRATLAWIRATLAWIGATLARIGATLARIGATLARIGATLAWIRATLAWIRATLARVRAADGAHDVRAAGGQVDGKEQYQESTAHSLHEGVPRSFGGSRLGELPRAPSGA